MHRPLALALATLLLSLPVAAQQPTTRPVTVLDPVAIRKQAAQLSEIRALLADSDPNVRLLAIREIAKSGDATQRQLAIDAGLSSAETSLQQVALRAVFADTQQIVVMMSKSDGSPITEGDVSFSLAVNKFDPESGRIEGNNWNGQVQGAVFAFYRGGLLGNLVWNPEAAEFEGTVNVNSGRIDGLRKAVWRPR